MTNQSSVIERHYYCAWSLVEFVHVCQIGTFSYTFTKSFETFRRRVGETLVFSEKTAGSKRSRESPVPPQHVVLSWCTLPLNEEELKVNVKKCVCGKVVSCNTLIG
jgi:hypothetical protein